MEKRLCPECGTDLQNKYSCKEYFDQMLAWDFSDFATIGKEHHLTVLCYYLQHPHYYSPEGLEKAIHILTDVIEKNLSDRELYQEESDVFSSEKRTWSVTGTSGHHGSYSPNINWTMTAASVVEDGIAKYPDHVRSWAKAIYTDLKRR